MNPFQIMDAVFDKETGELAMHETRVRISKTGQRVVVVRMKVRRRQADSQEDCRAYVY